MNPFRLHAGRVLAILGATLVPAFLHAAQPADPFAEGVRPTEPLTPGQQRAAFSLPEGFDIQLVASEPDIAKPMNLAFDAKGRLWVSDSVEYPWPAPLNTRGRDAIKVLSDFAPDGRARKITTFADGLNIPIGLIPYKNGVIAWSIPNIWFFEDTDGDGRSDRREILYGPLGWERDTHGNNASFRRGFDGWIYATHGFNNNTTLRGRDGSSITINSGNTYRIRPDGSRVEQFTFGQVNPFGLSFDPLGNLYSSDCHSQPAYQLLRGGYYPSFGKPHDGLGFAPEMVFHSHGSTAICGIGFYADGDWPAEYRNNIFTGNVMTSRVNRDQLEDHGTTRLAIERPDFVRTSDPWFRPVDIQFGPDGAMYVADFYNRIIGHYEVPLIHPGRDRFRGRIWRIQYQGGKSSGRGPPVDLSETSVSRLIDVLADANITRRMLATTELTDRIGLAAVKPVKRLLASASASPTQRAHGLWVLFRLGFLDEGTWLRLAQDRDATVRIHAMRAAIEMKELSPEVHKRVVAALSDEDAFAQRCAAEALSAHPSPANLEALLVLRKGVPEQDTHLLYVARKAIRDQLKAPGVYEELSKGARSEADSRSIAEVSVAVPTEAAGSFLLRHVQRFPETRASLTEYLRHVARHANLEEMPLLAGFARKSFVGETDLQLMLFKSVHSGFEQRGAALAPEVRGWGEELAIALLDPEVIRKQGWHNIPNGTVRDTTNPWFVQKRNTSDGDGNSMFICSLPPGGEALTGTLRSKPFRLPASLRFHLAGHDGYPDKPAQGKNLVQLRDARTDEILMRVPPPRNDTAQLVSWDLSSLAGRDAVLEVVDGDTGAAYAWLAAGRFEPPVIAVPPSDPSAVGRQLREAADLARTLKLARAATALGMLAQSDETDLEARAAAAQALVSFAPDHHRAALAVVIGEPSVPGGLRAQAARAIVGAPELAPSAVVEAFRVVSRRVQARLAQSLASSAAGAEAFLELVATSKAPAGLLLDRAVRDKIPANLTDRVTKLTATLPPANQTAQALIDKRRAGFEAAKPAIEKGAEVFTRNCAACHQIGGKGNLVGPQLDGIGNRGVERLLEDILDPNRALDHAFQTTVITLKDGDVVSGLFRREEGEQIFLADSTGKEINVKKSQVHERRESQTSLMPENFGEVIPDGEFYDLIAYLAAQRVAR